MGSEPTRYREVVLTSCRLRLQIIQHRVLLPLTNCSILLS